MVKVLAGYTTGIIFIKNNKSIAALQFGKDYVWLSTTEEEKYRILVGSCILALICVEEE